MFKIEKGEEYSRILYRQRGMVIYSYFNTVEYLDVGGCNVELYFKNDGFRVVTVDVRRYVFNELKKQYPDMKRFS